MLKNIDCLPSRIVLVYTAVGICYYQVIQYNVMFFEWLLPRAFDLSPNRYHGYCVARRVENDNDDDDVRCTHVLFPVGRLLFLIPGRPVLGPPYPSWSCIPSLDRGYLFLQVPNPYTHNGLEVNIALLLLSAAAGPNTIVFLFLLLISSFNAPKK